MVEVGATELGGWRWGILNENISEKYILCEMSFVKLIFSIYIRKVISSFFWRNWLPRDFIFQNFIRTKHKKRKIKNIF